jgi:hypothetical protein
MVSRWILEAENVTPSTGTAGESARVCWSGAKTLTPTLSRSTGRGSKRGIACDGDTCNGVASHMAVRCEPRSKRELELRA